MRDSSVWLTSSESNYDESCSTADGYTIREAVERGFRRLAMERYPERLVNQCQVLDQRTRCEGIHANPAQLEVHEWLQDYCPKISAVQIVLKEGGGLPEDGLHFDIPEPLHTKIPKALLSAVRRLHINCGHPPTSDLERIVRLAGGSKEACAAAQGIRCTVCDKAQRAKPPRPASVRKQVGQFNEVVLGDLVFVKDKETVTHGFLVLVDEATDYCGVRNMPSRKPVDLYAGMENADLLGWAARLLHRGWRKRIFLARVHGIIG